MIKNEDERQMFLAALSALEEKLREMKFGSDEKARSIINRIGEIKAKEKHIKGMSLDGNSD